jgi:hypothetical protein
MMLTVDCSLFTVNSQPSTVNRQHHSGVTGDDITIHCAVALSVTALVIKASTSVSAEKVEAFIRISIDRQTDTAPGN